MKSKNKKKSINEPNFPLNQIVNERMELPTPRPDEKVPPEPPVTPPPAKNS